MVALIRFPMNGLTVSSERSWLAESGYQLKFYVLHIVAVGALILFSLAVNSA